MTTTVPTTTSEVTAPWLTHVLRESGTIAPDASVSEVSAVEGAAGVGFVGEIGKLAVTYEGDARSAPSTMVAKFPSQSPEVLAMMRPTRIYEREHRFYGELAAQTPVRTPETYHITCNTSADEAVAEDYMIVMEDLGHLDIGDQVAGVTPEQAEAALVGLAAHHARFWNGAGLENADFIPIIDGMLNRAGQAIYEGSLPGFLEVFGDVLRPEMRPVAEAYTAAHPKLLGALAAMPKTLVHFDYRADNLFYDTDGSVVVIDWQAISQGGGAADVGYFMGQNLTVEHRRAHEDELLRTYHGALEANGVSGYSFEQFHDDYRLGIMYGWIIPVFAVGSLDVSSERAMSLWTAVLERVQSAIFDHNADEFVR